MIPDRIGRYEIKAEIGRGGMASVYLAHDPNIRREVAVKVLPVQFLDNPVLRVRFEREAQAIAAIEHPAIVPVYDFGDQERQLFLVMRYMRGGSLFSRLRRGALPLDLATHIISRLAAALDAVHARGIVHRDLKPGNILFDDSGEAFLSDFGIAQLAEATTVLTGDAIIGTPAYMSPEQVRGEDHLDGRSDVYALGIILFEMLTGNAPYRATTPMALAMKHLTEPPPQIRTLRPEFSTGLDSILSKALAKEREQRFSTAGELAAALQSLDVRSQPAVPVHEEPVASQYVAATVLETVLEDEHESSFPVEILPQPEPEVEVKSVPPSQVVANAEASPVQSPPIPVDYRRMVGPVKSPPVPVQIKPASPRRLAWVIGGLAGLGALCVLLAFSVLGGGMLLSAMNPQPEHTSTATTPQALVPEPDFAPTIVSEADVGTTPVPWTGYFKDDFSDTSTGWSSGEEASGAYGYDGGGYRLFVNQANTLYWSTPGQIASDLSIEVEATKIAGSDDNYFGLICRMLDENNYYYLVISSNGYYTMGKYRQAEFISFLEDGWGYSEWIHQGRTTNRIRADCLEDTLSLYANGILLHEAQDPDLVSGEFGLIAASLDLPGTNILFDNLVARQP